MDELKPIGREQYFWHYPKSNLPIRHITKKTEPHFEIGAENYLRACLPYNLQNFKNSFEKYLFLCTRCRNKKAGGGRFNGHRFIVGYIKRGDFIRRKNRTALIGKNYMVPFNEKLMYENLGLRRTKWMQKIDARTTKKILRRIHSLKNIRRKIIREMLRLEREACEAGKKIPLKKECLKKKCKYKKSCLRRKYE